LPQWRTSIKVMLQGADDSRRSRLELLALALVHGVVIDPDNMPLDMVCANTPAVLRRLECGVGQFVVM
jgi:hypothetical protein